MRYLIFITLLIVSCQPIANDTLNMDFERILSAKNYGEKGLFVLGKSEVGAQVLRVKRGNETERWTFPNTVNFGFFNESKPAFLLQDTENRVIHYGKVETDQSLFSLSIHGAKWANFAKGSDVLAIYYDDHFELKNIVNNQLIFSESWSIADLSGASVIMSDNERHFTLYDDSGWKSITSFSIANLENRWDFKEKESLFYEAYYVEDLLIARLDDEVRAYQGKDLQWIYSSEGVPWNQGQLRLSPNKEKMVILGNNKGKYTILDLSGEIVSDFKDLKGHAHQKGKKASGNYQVEYFGNDYLVLSDDTEHLIVQLDGKVTSHLKVNKNETVIYPPNWGEDVYRINIKSNKLSVISTKN
ncbi:hypothetical protein [Idiomarina sp. ST10R2A5]|uniref:hypothetical protein n=1 Tax=Idiomarina sp. ST10R2A5 TaxID=3418368 RepID=UPI003EC81FFF